MRRTASAFHLLLVGAMIGLTGCHPTQPFYLHEDGDLSHYIDKATQAETPDGTPFNDRTPANLDAIELAVGLTRIPAGSADAQSSAHVRVKGHFRRLRWLTLVRRVDAADGEGRRGNDQKDGDEDRTAKAQGHVFPPYQQAFFAPNVPMSPKY